MFTEQVLPLMAVLPMPFLTFPFGKTDLKPAEGQAGVSCGPPSPGTQPNVVSLSWKRDHGYSLP